MNRRDFFARASLALAGIAATCGLLPEVAKAQPRVVRHRMIGPTLTDEDRQWIVDSTDQRGRGYTFTWDANVRVMRRTNFTYWRGVTEQ